MQPYFNFLLIIAAVIMAIVIVLFAQYRRNSHTELYKEGVRNENDGHYDLALQNYEDALSEIHKLKLDNDFGIRISQRMKVLRNFMQYEQNVQIFRPVDTMAPFVYKMNK